MNGLDYTIAPSDHPVAHAVIVSGNDPLALDFVLQDRQFGRRDGIGVSCVEIYPIEIGVRKGG